MNLRTITSALVAVACLSLAQAQNPTDNAASETPAAQPAASRNYPIIAELRTIKTRLPDGKLDRFVDSANREFAVHYNPNGSIDSVGAVRGRHASDIERISYGPLGQIMEVAMGNGYALYFTYADNGTQVIRDRYGGVFTRKTNGESTLHSDPAGKLQLAISGLDAVLAAAGR